ncbi:23S rRNA (guanosine(2251)-2'-O)-methyltransferase RlmB [Fundicoccus culcitae]|uniref:23S rRNA (Guanosine(2251)-2'-O)-methyltransferase RlmB n=1 Tax=Fundicoccus culcitae TaxID=2969821 RepID=A0ABY5P357_9LACT|nr:23S rRNA (guanosine(2251)-2'-O)-methyltransferase RlmB [Fundicoccus culcitae]UUX33040.1 23S rRNA (guanosine(2251)-2'-O)-methyltransferase RlmB [Fundicoccus culcitae]
MSQKPNQREKFKGKKTGKAHNRPEAAKKNEDESTNNEFFYGKHAVLSILEEKKPVNKLFLQVGVSGNHISDILDLVKQQGIVYQEVPKSKLDDMTNGANHQGVVVSMSPIPYADLEDGFALATSRGEDPFFIILDGIEDPHNLGSIIRTADATGVHGIIIPKRRAVGLTAVVAKTSAGAIERVPIIRVTNLSQTMDQLKDRGIWIFATTMDGQDMRQWSSKGPIALIIGNEGQGVSANVIAKSDGTVTIPMVGKIQSLNASVAAAVVMYEVARSRIPLPSKN